MGGRYCAINSPRGSQWGRKSRDWRSRYFCPCCGRSRELTAQYRPPMSFRFYPTLYLGNHLYFCEAWQFLKTAKEYIYLARYRFPNGSHLLRMVQPIRSPENPGTTVVSDTKPHGPKTLDITPKCGIMWSNLHWILLPWVQLIICQH